MIFMNTSADARDENMRLARMLFWVLLSGIAAGLILPLTYALAGRQDGDGLLTALISTRKLTWYFWEQDRFLNLIPALTAGFENPGTNLHVQVLLRACFTYLSPLAILVFFTRSARTLLLSIALANIMLVASLGHYGWFNLYVQHNPFGTSMVLFALAYLLMAHLSVLRLLVIGLLCLLAYATNFALLIFTGPLLFILMVAKPEARGRLFGFGLINATAIVGAFLHSKSMNMNVTQFGVVPSLESLQQATNVLYELLNVPAFLSLLVLTLICTATLSLTREQRRTFLLELSAPLISALVMVLVLSVTIWVKMNGFNVRYFLTGEIAVAAVMAYVVALRLEQTNLGDKRTALLIVAIFAMLVFGPMGGFTKTYKELISEDRRLQSKAIARAAVDARSTVIAGDFWDVWPVVYETQRLRAREAQPLPVFGAAVRASALSEQFRALAERSPEQSMLCFLPAVDACLTEVRNQLRLSQNIRFETGAVKTVTLAGKPMLDIRFRLSREN